MLPCREQQTAAYKGNRKIEFCPDRQTKVSKADMHWLDGIGLRDRTPKSSLGGAFYLMP